MRKLFKNVGDNKFKLIVENDEHPLARAESIGDDETVRDSLRGVPPSESMIKIAQKYGVDIGKMDYVEATDAVWEAMLSRQRRGGKLVPENTPHVSGMKPDAARPAGSQVFDATVHIGLTTLMIDTEKGSVELALTPEQIQQLKSELHDLK